jgi:hypothetical protein
MNVEQLLRQFRLFRRIKRAHAAEMKPPFDGTGYIFVAVAQQAGADPVRGHIVVMLAIEIPSLASACLAETGRPLIGSLQLRLFA